MSSTKIGLMLLGLVTLTLIGFTTDWRFGMGSSKPVSQTHSVQVPLAAGFTVGDQRGRMLEDLTKLYVARNEGSSPLMKAGKEFAPAEFLNEELKRNGAKWRVRSSDGTDVEMYDIS